MPRLKRKKVVVEVTILLPEPEVAELERMLRQNYRKGITLGHVAGKRVKPSDKASIANGISNWLYGKGGGGN